MESNASVLNTMGSILGDNVSILNTIGSILGGQCLDVKHNWVDLGRTRSRSSRQLPDLVGQLLDLAFSISQSWNQSHRSWISGRQCGDLGFTHTFAQGKFSQKPIDWDFDRSILKRCPDCTSRRCQAKISIGSGSASLSSLRCC